MTPRRFYRLFAAASLLTFMLVNDFTPVVVFGQGKGTANVWTDAVVIERKPKANRKYRKRIRSGEKKKTRLLTLQWQMFKQDAKENPRSVDPDSEFYTDDRLQLVIKVNQPGYIYILDEEGGVKFPSARINGGKNYVPQYYMITIPSNCSPEYMDKQKRCWWRLLPPVPESGRETLFVIFSRDEIKDLPNNAQEARERVKKQLISELKSDSPNPETVKPGQRFVTWVTNSNPKDNEELVATLYITHLKPKNQ